VKNDIDSLRKNWQKFVLCMLSAKEQAQVVKEKPKTERVVERIIERPTTPSQPAKLTGHALLDKLFM